MRDDLRCGCHICEVEDHLFNVLAEPPGNSWFLALAASSPVLAKFTDISELLAYLHSHRTADYDWSDAGETLTALLASRATARDSELVHSVLVLALLSRCSLVSEGDYRLLYAGKGHQLPEAAVAVRSGAKSKAHLEHHGGGLCRPTTK